MKIILEKYKHYQLSTPLNSRPYKFLKKSRDREVKSWEITDTVKFTTREDKDTPAKEHVLKYIKEGNYFVSDDGLWKLEPVAPFKEDFKNDMWEFLAGEKIGKEGEKVAVISQTNYRNWPTVRMGKSLHKTFNLKFSEGYDTVIYSDRLSVDEINELLTHSKRGPATGLNCLYSGARSNMGMLIEKEHWEGKLDVKKGIFNFFKNISENIARHRLKVNYINP